MHDAWTLHFIFDVFLFQFAMQHLYSRHEDVDRTPLLALCSTELLAYIVSSLCLLLLSMLVIVMMPVAAPTTGFGLGSPRRAKRFRSVSVSIDIEFPEHIGKPPIYYRKLGGSREQQQRQILSNDRFRTMSTNYVEKYRSLVDSEIMSSKAKGLAMLRRAPDIFPFQSLPDDCKQHIFSFLNMKERGVAAQVCTDWSEKIRSPSLWNIIDFTDFPLCEICSETGRECNILCYTAYKSRMKKFFRYLVELRPTIHYFRCAYDIGDHKDGWLDLIQSLFRSARCQDLQVIELNWKETQIKPSSFKSESATWSTSDCNDLMFNHRHRQRLFVKFFDLLVAAAPNVTKMVLPFDWSDRSLRAIGRLKKLEVLVLQQYFWFQGLEQKSITQLFHVAPHLKHLVLEVWTPNGHGLQSYTIESDELEHLDVSQSRGFQLECIRMPNLKVLKISRHVFSGPLTNLDALHVACLYQVLCEGTPKLRQLNDVILRSCWKENLYEEFEQVLNAICSCPVHKPV